MVKRLFVILLLLVLCAGCAGPVNASAPAAPSQKIAETGFIRQHPGLVASFEQEARRIMETDGIPGMSVALTDDQGTLWAEGFGYVDKAHSRPVDADTIFSLQSISKTITGTVLVEAANRGVLDLNKTVDDYLPDFTVNSVYEDHPEQKMTLKNLLSHTAGFTHEAAVGSNGDANAVSFEEHIRSISGSWLRCPVGQDYAEPRRG